MNRLSFIVGAIALFLCSSGCSKKVDPVASVEKLEKAFETSPKSDLTEEQRAVQDAVTAAVKATKSNDPETAGVSLQVLRSAKDLSPAQRMAVQDAMGDLQTQLATRAEAGDAAAIRALNTIRASARR